MEQWLFHVLRYTARNALSHTVAFAQVGVAHHAFPFLLRDNDYVDPPDRTTRIAHEARTDTVEPFDLEHEA